MATENTSLKLFYCYAREDKTLRDELEIHLSGLKRHYKLPEALKVLRPSVAKKAGRPLLPAN